jgi:hypothetical protein
LTRNLLVTRTNGKKFRISVPEDAKVTFGPWSPPGDKTRAYNEKSMAGTLRVYENASTKASILGCFSDVVSFREECLDYEEEVITQEVATIWKSDNKGFRSEQTARVASSFDDPQLEEGKDDSDW